MTKRLSLALLLLALLTLAWPGNGAAFAAHPSTGAIASTGAAPATATRVNVAIQAGHWKSNELPDVFARLRGNTGASGGGRTEAQVNVDIAQRVVRILKAKGLTAEVLPATVPTGYEADLFISLHADGNANTRPRGYKVSTRWRSDVAALDALLTESLISSYGNVTGMPRDSSVTRAMRGYYAYSTYRGEDYRLSSTTPAAILEMGFMSNATDRSIMFNNPELIARGVVSGIDKFYAQRAEGQRLQAKATAQAAASDYNRAVVVLTNGVNIRASGSTSAAKVGSANLGASFPVTDGSASQRTGGGSSGTFDPSRGTQLVTSDSWYRIDVPDSTADAYVSRDLVVVQQ